MRIKSCISLLTVVLVVGCGRENLNDLQDYRNKVLARKSSPIEPIPSLTTYEKYNYKAKTLGLRDPFKGTFKRQDSSFTSEAHRTDLQKRYALETDSREREELENSELDSLRMVGTIKNNGDFWGIIRDKQGVVHWVEVGNYMGRNFGKITGINEEKIKIREITKNNLGRWEERDASLVLIEQ